MMNEVLPNKTKIRCDQNSVENELGCIMKYHLKKKEKKKTLFFPKNINVMTHVLLIKLKFVILYRAKIQPSKRTRSTYN